MFFDRPIKWKMPRTWLYRWTSSPEPDTDTNWEEWHELMNDLERNKRRDNVRKIRKFARIIAMEIRRGRL